MCSRSKRNFRSYFSSKFNGSYNEIKILPPGKGKLRVAFELTYPYIDGYLTLIVITLFIIGVLIKHMGGVAGSLLGIWELIHLLVLGASSVSFIMSLRHLNATKGAKYNL